MSSLTALNDQARRATLGWYADPGHAWLVVSLDEEHGLPIATQFASSFSFIDATGDNFAGIVYLEEDEDAVAFIKAYGIDARTLPIWSVDEESEIRNLPRGVKA